MDKRKNLVCLTTILIIILLSVLPASTQGTIVRIANVEEEYGSSIIVPLMINNVTKLGGGGVNVTYDPSVIHVINVTTGDMSLDAQNINNISGWVYIIAHSAHGKSDDVVFSNIDFKAVGNATEVSPLNITVYKLVDTSYNHIQHTTTNGTFTILSSGADDTPPVTPTSTPTPEGVSGGGDGPFLFTPSPTLTPTATPTVTETPTLAPTFTPSASPTPTQTPSSTTPPPTTNEQKRILMLIIGLMAVSIVGIIIYTAFKLRKK